MNQTVVPVEGYLNQTTGIALRDHVRELLALKPPQMTLDFSTTKLVNSIGVSFLLELIDLAAKQGTKLEFTGVGADINDLFQLLGISARVPVKP